VIVTPMISCYSDVPLMLQRGSISLIKPGMIYFVRSGEFCILGCGIVSRVRDFPIATRFAMRL